MKKYKTVECSDCGKSAKVVRGNYQTEEFGLPVELMHIEMVKCKCGNVEPIIRNLDGLMTTIAFCVVLSPSLLHGEEIRYLRKYVGKTARQFAQLVHVDHTHLSKLENNRLEVGASLDKLIRVVIFGTSPELSDKLDQLMEQLPKIEDNFDDNKPELRINPADLQACCA